MLTAAPVNGDSDSYDDDDDDDDDDSGSDDDGNDKAGGDDNGGDDDDDDKGGGGSGEKGVTTMTATAATIATTLRSGFLGPTPVGSQPQRAPYNGWGVFQLSRVCLLLMMSHRKPSALIWVAVGSA